MNQDLDDKNRRLCHLESSVEHLKEELTTCKEDLEVNTEPFDLKDVTLICLYFSNMNVNFS